MIDRSKYDAEDLEIIDVLAYRAETHEESIFSYCGKNYYIDYNFKNNKVYIAVFYRNAVGDMTTEEFPTIEDFFDDFKVDGKAFKDFLPDLESFG